MSKPEPAETICAKLAESLARGTFARLMLSSPIASGEGPQKILGRFVMLRGAPHLSLTLRYATRDVTKNLPVNEAGDWLREQVGTQFRSALVCTTQRDWQFISRENGEARLIDHRPSAKQTPPPEHDQKRAGVLDTSAGDWLQGLGILDRDGKLRASMADKHRQINHYLEILSHLARDCGWAGAPVSDPARTFDHAPSAPGRRPALQFADMGCGKGYLTFGLWHWLARVQKQPVQVLGVETRADLVTASNKLAREIKAEGLEFIRGDIASAPLSSLDGLIALHACNTATDDAIRRGIELHARLIVVAPCCHQEIRPQLGAPAPLAPVLRHGLMAERMAEWTTDGLRALFLEWAGYHTKIMEFIGGEHTPKNLMLAAVRDGEPFSDAAARQRIVELKRFFGIERHALDAVLQSPGGEGVTQPSLSSINTASSLGLS